MICPVQRSGDGHKGDDCPPVVVEPLLGGGDGLHEPYVPHVMLWIPWAESIVQLWLHATVELQIPGQVPPSACSTLPGTSGGSSGAEEHPSDVSVTNATAESTRAKVKERLRFDVDMIFLLIKRSATPAPSHLDARRRS
jgi:hypothetical protein